MGDVLCWQKEAKLHKGRGAIYERQMMFLPSFNVALEYVLT